jgi:hypothetical protein
MRIVLLIRTRGPQQVDKTKVQYKRSVLFSSKNDGNVCVALNNAARPELKRCPGADMQPVRSVSERAQAQWGMDLQQ